jgi:hypothetical protein
MRRGGGEKERRRGVEREGGRGHTSEMTWLAGQVSVATSHSSISTHTVLPDGGSAPVVVVVVVVVLPEVALPVVMVPPLEGLQTIQLERRWRWTLRMESGFFSFIFLSYLFTRARSSLFSTQGSSKAAATSWLPFIPHPGVPSKIYK